MLRIQVGRGFSSLGRLVFGDGVVVKIDFTHTKDQLAGFNLNAGFVETLYGSLQKLLF
jgi:hypothetical protein